jgi:hypothetical protein
MPPRQNSNAAIPKPGTATTRMTRSSSKLNASGASLMDGEKRKNTEKKRKAVVNGNNVGARKKVSTFRNPFENTSSTSNPPLQITTSEMSVAQSIALDDHRFEMKKSTKGARISANGAMKPISPISPTPSSITSPEQSMKHLHLESPPIDPALAPISPLDPSKMPHPSRFTTPNLPSESNSYSSRSPAATRGLSITAPRHEAVSRGRFGDTPERERSLVPTSRASSVIPQSRAPSVSRGHFGDTSERGKSFVPSSRASSVVPQSRAPSVALLAPAKFSSRFDAPFGISSARSRPSKVAPGDSSLPEFHSQSTHSPSSLHLPASSNPQARIPKALTDKIVVMEANIKKLNDEVREAHAAITLSQTKNKQLADDLETMRGNFSDAWAKQERELDDAINMMRERFQIKSEDGEDLPIVVNSEPSVRDNIFNVSLSSQSYTRD